MLTSVPKNNCLKSSRIAYVITLALFFPIFLCSQTNTIAEEAASQFSQRNFAEAEQLWKKVAKQYKEEGNPDKEIDAILEIVRCAMHISKMEESKHHLFEAERLANKYNLKDKKARILNSLTTIYEFANQEDSVIITANRILNIPNIEDRYYSDAYSSLAMIYEFKGDTQKQEEYINKAIDLDMITQDSSSLPFNLTTLARLQSNRTQYDLAISSYLEALGYLRKGKDKFKYPSIYSSIAELFLSMNNLEKAEEYAQQALVFCNELNLKSTKSRAYNALGSVYKRRKKYAKALNYYTKSDSILEHINGRQSYKIFAKIGKASCKTHLGQYEDIPVLFDFIKKNLKDIDQNTLVLDYKALEAHYNFASNPRSSLPYLNEAKEMATAQNNIHEQSFLLGLISEYHYLFNNYKKAFDYNKKSLQLKDSIYKIQQSYFVHDLEAKYKKNEQASEIKYLAAQNNFKTFQLKQQRIIIWGSVAVAIILGILLSFIASLFGKVKSQKNVVEKSLQEKNILLKEIHHRVKNNLQVISSLLALQSKYIKDDTALDALKQGQDRVHSMALIHQDLYEGKDLIGVSTASYFEQLIDNLFYSYNISEDEVRLNLEVEDLTLDVDTMIPLGLVLNELISNAFKHAFKNNSNNAAIDISLKEINDTLLLIVKDNGNSIKSTKSIEGKSFGFELIKAFSKKLNAKLEMEIDHGLSIKLLIKNYSKAA